MMALSLIFYALFIYDAAAARCLLITSFFAFHTTTLSLIFFLDVTPPAADVMLSLIALCYADSRVSTSILQFTLLHAAFIESLRYAAAAIAAAISIHTPRVSCRHTSC